MGSTSDGSPFRPLPNIARIFRACISSSPCVDKRVASDSASPFHFPDCHESPPRSYRGVAYLEMCNMQQLAVWPRSTLPDMAGIGIVSVERDGEDGLIVTFTDGTTGAYLAGELLELRPCRELTHESGEHKPPQDQQCTEEGHYQIVCERRSALLRLRPIKFPLSSHH